MFLRNKDKPFEKFNVLHKNIQNQKETSMVEIRSDHGKEFENNDFKRFFHENGISHNFLAPRTPQ